MIHLAARLDLEIIWLLVIVLIGIVSAIRGFIQRRMLEQQRAERGGKPPPPVATQVRQVCGHGAADGAEADDGDALPGHPRTQAASSERCSARAPPASGSRSRP